VKKQSVCVDLDGVLARYEGWTGVEDIGKPIAGAKLFMQDLMKEFYVIVFTTRASAQFNPGYSEEELKIFVEKWLNKHGIPYDSIYTGRGKPLATAYVDDRAVSCAPMRVKNPHLAFNNALWEVKRLAKITEEANDGDYIRELEKMGLLYDGSSISG